MWTAISGDDIAGGCVKCPALDPCRASVQNLGPTGCEVLAAQPPAVAPAVAKRRAALDWLQSQPGPVTVAQVMDQFGYSRQQSYRILTKTGRVYCGGPWGLWDYPPQG